MLMLLAVLLTIALLLPPDNTQRAFECRAKGGSEEELTGRESRLAGHQNRLQNRAPPFKVGEAPQADKFGVFRRESQGGTT